MYFNFILSRPGGRASLCFDKHLYGAILLATILILSHPVAAADDDGERRENLENGPRLSPSSTEIDGLPTKIANDSHKSETVAVKLYRKLFKQKHASHLEAVQKIFQLGSYEKQYKMVQLILTKLFTVMLDARIKLTEAGFSPGDPFPEDEQVRDALSIILENTAFLGEIVLRLPDMTHAMMRNNSDWKMAVRWGIDFCNDTKILSGSEEQLLNLMAQELEIIEKRPDFVNPYREDTKLEAMVDEEAEKLLKEKLKEARRKERKEKKKQRGPKLSSPRHNEL